MTEQSNHYARDIMAALVDDGLMQFAPGERLWKLYIFRPSSGQATRLEHHIYCKQKTDGRLAMVTFAIHSPEPDRSIRSGVARVPDLQPGALDQIIRAIRQETQTLPDEYEEIDLSGRGTLAEQLAYLRERADVSHAS